MKLPAVLFILLTLLNFLSLYFVLGLFGGEGIKEFTAKVYNQNGHARFTVCLFYITTLLNLYCLFYIAVRRLFKE